MCLCRWLLSALLGRSHVRPARTASGVRNGRSLCGLTMIESSPDLERNDIAGWSASEAREADAKRLARFVLVVGRSRALVIKPPLVLRYSVDRVFDRRSRLRESCTGHLAGEPFCLGRTSAGTSARRLVHSRSLSLDSPVSCEATGVVTKRRAASIEVGQL
jgi:hypothetical protein